MFKISAQGSYPGKPLEGMYAQMQTIKHTYVKSRETSKRYKYGDIG